MSNVEMNSSDEDYYPSNERHRNSCPNKKMSFSSKCLNPFTTDMPTPNKRSSKNKTDGSKCNHNTGRWSKEEHKKFLEAIKIYGRDWKKVEGYVGTRTSTQARSHAQKVLPHPSAGEGINQSHNSTSTTFTKGSPQSQKNFVGLEYKKNPSIASDGDSSEFAIFKVEKVRKPMIGRDRVNSENNVFRFQVDSNCFSNGDEKRAKYSNRKYSMNIEVEHPKNDLIGSPIKECIKEQIGEDEEEDGMDEFPNLAFTRHKTCGAKPVESFDHNPLF